MSPHPTFLASLATVAAVVTALAVGPSRRWTFDRLRTDRGQTTAEYALVILGAAAIAVLILSWATDTNVIGKLFDFVIGKVIGRAG